MRTIATALALGAALLLVACGGGGGGCDAGTPGFTGVTNTCVPTGGPATTPVATQLALQLSGTSIDNSGARVITATATASTAGGQTVAGVPVTFTVDNNAIYTPSATTTNDSGVVTASISIGSDRSNRIVTVTAISGNLTATSSFAVTGATLTGTRVPAVVAPSSTGNRVDFRLVDANNNPMAGQPVTVTAGALGSVTGKTGTAGDYSFNYTAPATPGTLDITASSGGVSNTQTVTIQVASGNTVPAVTTQIRSASVSADPSVVAPNDATTNNRVEVRALFVGPDSKPIQNVRVRFDLGGDPYNVGGAFSTGNNIVYTDALGVATTAYIPGSRSSPTDGVIIRACYDVVDFTTCDASKTATKTLTVAAPPLAVTIGSNREVIVAPLTYKQQFVVLVVDSAGVAKANVSIVPSIDLLYFYKGFYAHASNGWTNNCTNTVLCNPVVPAPVSCPNEDLNRNGVLELGEDINGNGALDPRKSDVAVSVVGSSLTDSSGKATIQIEYPKNVGSWLTYRILISATGVAGTEGRASWTDILLVPISDVQAEGAPAFVRSPYGVETRTVNSVKPCANPG